VNSYCETSGGRRKGEGWERFGISDLRFSV
jgi:hypothetical protein